MIREILAILFPCVLRGEIKFATKFTIKELIHINSARIFPVVNQIEQDALFFDLI
jgi:hypothetical protein